MSDFSLKHLRFVIKSITLISNHFQISICEKGISKEKSKKIKNQHQLKSSLI